MRNHNGKSKYKPANSDTNRNNEYKSLLLKMFSHDIKSPLSGITGVTEILRELTDERDLEKHHLLDMLSESTQHLYQMIKEITNFTILEVDGFTLKTEKTNMQKTVGYLENFYRTTAKIKEIDFTVTTVNLDQPVSVDQQKVEQIIGNLLSNAFKFTDGGGIVALKAEKQNEPDRLELTISDSGVGMTSDELRRILNVDQDESAGQTEGYRENGMGMSIVKHFVHLHRGNLQAESEPGKGTKFVVTIPLD